ncbi:heme exporter protein CcmD [Kordiimonas aestuarii]|uniref:heme exporter protein CcmD n=1 Tax=Kordiimonas aestuarii TaxID=1005925 RepID=UPI0021D1C6DE|nr:heme exporter protein CcmD [Kordiimonas aestuarii]
MAEFLDMGGYAAFVWTAYGLTALALVVLAVSSLRAGKKARDRVEQLRPRRRKGQA